MFILRWAFSFSPGIWWVPVLCAGQLASPVSGNHTWPSLGDPSMLRPLDLPGPDSLRPPPPHTPLEIHVTGVRLLLCAQTALLMSQSSGKELLALLFSVLSFPLFQNAPPISKHLSTGKEQSNKQAHWTQGVSLLLLSHPCLRSSTCVKHFKELVSFL